LFEVHDSKVDVIRNARSALGRGWDWAALRARCLREARRVLPRAEAEEAVQEALARAWTRRHSCRTPEAPLPWVLEITRNESRRLIERRARRQLRIPIEPVPSDPEVEDDALTGTTTRVIVEQALERLGDADRRMLRLRYGDDLTHAEVARRLGVPVGTVKVRLHRARGRLRVLLEEPS
jgi:RNA polymerase sigma-70 factor, ECF subfamily